MNRQGGPLAKRARHNFQELGFEWGGGCNKRKETTTTRPPRLGGEGDTITRGVGDEEEASTRGRRDPVRKFYRLTAAAVFCYCCLKL